MANVNLDTLSLPVLIYLHAAHLDLVSRDCSFDVIAKLNDNSVFIDWSDEPTILFMNAFFGR